MNCAVCFDSSGCNYINEAQTVSPFHHHKHNRPRLPPLCGEWWRDDDDASCEYIHELSFDAHTHTHTRSLSRSSHTLWPLYWTLNSDWLALHWRFSRSDFVFGSLLLLLLLVMLFVVTREQWVRARHHSTLDKIPFGNSFIVYVFFCRC